MATDNGSDTIAAGQPYKTVTHALGATPSVVHPTPNDDLGDRQIYCPVANRTTTTFRVYINNLDPGNAHDFDWFAST